MLTPSARPWAAACLVAAGITAAAMARPLRYEVEGLSMAPGLLPGDVVGTGSFSRLPTGRAPRRFERWVIRAPDGTAAIKRLAGLPGEQVSIRDGDLSIDGRRLVAPPPVLAETASVVTSVAPSSAGSGGRRRHQAVEPGVIFDDAAFAPTERRVLLPVRDVGLAAVVRMRDPGTSSLSARVGGCVVAWRPPSAGRFAVVAGRLDGQLVAACWRCPADGGKASDRSCLPAGLPAAWQVERPWPEVGPTDAAAEADVAPRLAVWIGGEPPADGREPIEDGVAAGDIEEFVVWRDVLHRPAAEGRETWLLGPDDYLLLGDFPSGSRDSRHWGPLRRKALVAAVAETR